MIIKVKENFQQTRHVKINQKSRKYILGGGRNVRYYDKILSKSKSEGSLSKSKNKHSTNNFLTTVCIRMFEINLISFLSKNNLVFNLFELLLLEQLSV